MKSGWIRKRSRHLKQWRKRFIQIEDQYFLCSYHNETQKRCTKKIDIRLATIQYCIDTATQFQIQYQHDDKAAEMHFECESIAEANEWLKCLKTICAQDTNDLDLIIPSTPPSNTYHQNQSEGKQISDIEVAQLYLKAISLYQHKHYEECRFVVNSVLTIQPTHPEALKLLAYLANKRTHKLHVQKPRERLHSAPSILDPHHRNRRNADADAMQPIPPKNKHKFTFFKSIDAKEEYDEKHADVAKNNEAKMHPCQREFNRFLVEKTQLNQYYPDLMDRFVGAKYNDIRFLKDFDENILKEEIKLRALHRKCFMRKVEIFLNEVRLFVIWLNRVVIKQRKQNTLIENKIISDGLIAVFENEGITTFEALYLHVQSRNALEKIMNGKKEWNDVIWNEMHRIKGTQHNRMESVAQTYFKLDTMVMISKDSNDDMAISTSRTFKGPGFSFASSHMEGILRKDTDDNNDLDIIKHINRMTPDLIINEDEPCSYKGTDNGNYMDMIVEPIEGIYSGTNGEIGRAMTSFL